MPIPAQRPIAFVLAATSHGAMLVNRNDYHAVDGAIFGVGQQLFETSSFDHHEIALITQLLADRRQHFGDGVVVIDCGANIGVHTIECAKFMHGWGDVIAFEAQERIFYALAGNITLNNCFNARAVWAAVGRASGQIGVPTMNYLTPASFGSLEIAPSRTPEYIGQQIDYSESSKVPTNLIALDDLNIQRLDFIKMDIEGMEMDALEGARGIIKTLRPQMLIEKIKSDEAALKAFTAELGYVTFPFGLNLLAIHQSDPVLPRIERA